MLNGKPLLILVVGLLFIVMLSIFTVDERERAILVQFGNIKRADYESGLHFKMPFVQNVRKFDGRIQILDSAPQRYLTAEKKNVSVDSFVMWRIEKVEDYFTSTGGEPSVAAARLSTVIQKRLKDEFGKRTIREVVSGERAEIMSILSTSAQEQASSLGVEIVDVRIKRIDLPEDVSESVYQRMAAERKEVAKQFRSRGEESAKTIRAEANREREVILAEASRDGQQLRGEGDGKASEIYANAYGENEEFYSLYRSLNAYKSIFSERSDVILMQPNSEFFKYFNSPERGAAKSE